MTSKTDRITAGDYARIGAITDKDGVNFALFSAIARSNLRLVQRHVRKELSVDDIIGQTLMHLFSARQLAR